VLPKQQWNAGLCPHPRREAMPLQKTRLAIEGEEAVRIKPTDDLVSTPHFQKQPGHANFDLDQIAIPAKLIIIKPRWKKSG
jgi:hypothetical protein